MIGQNTSEKRKAFYLWNWIPHFDKAVQNPSCKDVKTINHAVIRFRHSGRDLDDMYISQKANETVKICPKMQWAQMCRSNIGDSLLYISSDITKIRHDLRNSSVNTLRVCTLQTDHSLLHVYTLCYRSKISTCRSSDKTPIRLPFEKLWKLYHTRRSTLLRLWVKFRDFPHS